MGAAAVTIHFKDMRIHEDVKETTERRCHDLGDEFPELTHLEVTIEPTGDGFSAGSHATGKATEVATRAKAAESGPAAIRALDKLRMQLRRVHDKRIFAQRRTAQRIRPKRA